MKNTILISIALLLLGFNSKIKAQEMTMKQMATKMDEMGKPMIPARAEDISPLLIGEKIPNGILKDIEGKPFNVSKAVSEKLTVLIFYRGGVPLLFFTIVRITGNFARN